MENRLLYNFWGRYVTSITIITMNPKLIKQSIKS